MFKKKKLKKSEFKKKFFVERWIVKDIYRNEYLSEAKDGIVITHSFKAAMDKTPKFFKSKLKAKIAMKWYIFSMFKKEEAPGRSIYKIQKVCLPKQPK